MSVEDRKWMEQALTLAARGRGFVEPNPMVGAVVVRDGVLVGSGFHERYGQAHAEVNALTQAGEAARGATLYVTLEPCCHHGKTPPCTDAVLRSGIRRVVAAMTDPFPAVAGRGSQILRDAGVEYEVGLCETEALRLNAPYLKLLRTGTPWVHAKWAMTLDGKIATRTGHSQWISNDASRRRVHELRGRVDAIVCGIGTVLVDDPQLTARPPGSRIATRVVLDHTGRIPDTCHLLRTAREIPTVVVARSLNADNRQRLERQGVEVWEGEQDVLRTMGHRRWTNILIEGGASVLGSFLDARLIDEFHIFVAPRLVGGRTALNAVGGLGVERMDEGLRLVEMRLESLEGDCYFHGYAAESKSHFS